MGEPWFSHTDKIVETEEGATELCALMLASFPSLHFQSIRTLITLHDDTHPRADASIDQLQRHQLRRHLVRLLAVVLIFSARDSESRLDAPRLASLWTAAQFRRPLRRQPLLHHLGPNSIVSILGNLGQLSSSTPKSCHCFEGRFVFYSRSLYIHHCSHSITPKL